MAAILGHIGAGQDTDRGADHDGNHGEDEAADNRIEQAASRAGRRGHFGKYCHRQAGKALPQQRTQDQHQPAKTEHCGGQRQDRRGGVSPPAAFVAGF